MESLSAIPYGPPLTRTGDLAACPPGAIWPDRCHRCGVPTTDRAPHTLSWRDPRREHLIVLIPLALMAVMTALGEIGGFCAAMALPFLLYPFTIRRRAVEIGACHRHAAQLRNERWFRWSATLVALLSTLGIAWAILADRTEVIARFPLPITVTWLGSGLVALLAWFSAGPLPVRSAGPDRLLIDVAPAFLAALPPDPADAPPAPAADAAGDLVSAGSPAASADDPGFNPFAALPARAAPPVGHLCRDGLEVLAPQGAPWPDRCVCCGRPATARVSLHLLPLPWPLARLSMPLGLLLSPIRAPSARIGVCDLHRALRAAGLVLLPASLLGIWLALRIGNSEQRLLTVALALISLMVAIWLTDDRALLGYDRGVARLRMPPAFLSVLPAAPPASRPAPRSPGSAPTASGTADPGR